MEKYKVWIPVQETLGVLDFEGLCHDSNGLTIFIYNDKYKIKVNFEFFIMYRSADEGKLLSVIQNNPFGESCFFKVENSNFINYFHSLNYDDVYSDLNLEHFAIYTSSECIDIIATVEPLITVEQFTLPRTN